MGSNSHFFNFFSGSSVFYSTASLLSCLWLPCCSCFWSTALLMSFDSLQTLLQTSTFISNFQMDNYMDTQLLGTCHLFSVLNACLPSYLHLPHVHAYIFWFKSWNEHHILKKGGVGWAIVRETDKGGASKWRLNIWGIRWWKRWARRKHEKGNILAALVWWLLFLSPLLAVLWNVSREGKNPLG